MSDILLNDGTSSLLLNDGTSTALLSETTDLAENNGTDLFLLNDGATTIGVNADPYTPPSVPAAPTVGYAAEFETFEDHLESSSPVPPDLFTICYWARLKKGFVTSGAQRATFSIENTAGTSYIIELTTFNADTIEVHDSTLGGFLFSQTDLSGDGWFFVAETNDFAGGPVTNFYWQRDGLGPLLNVTNGINHVSVPTVNVMLIGSDSAGGQNENWVGGLNRFRMWNVVLTKAELEAEMASATTVKTANLWADYPLAPGASFLNDVSGNARHLTNPSGSGAWQTIQGPLIGDNPGVSGSLARTQANHTSAATATHGVSGSLARTGANATSAAAGTFPFTGTLAVTGANSTSAATATHGVSGSLARTQANSTSAATAAHGVTGSLAVTQANSTSAGAGVHGVSGSLARTGANSTCAASGTFTGGGAGVSGSALITSANSTLSATAFLGVSGSSASTSGNSTCAAAGTYRLSAAEAQRRARADRLAAQVALQRAKEIRYRLMSIRRYPWFR